MSIVSQPLEIIPSQFPYPVSHVPRTHVPAVHVGTECGKKVHGLEQVPQFIGSVARLASQPLNPLPSQSEYPDAQDSIAHR